MCIAIYKPKDIELTREALQNSYNSNRDGAGFAYIEPAGVAPHFLAEPEICIEKGYFDFNKFLEAYEPHKLKTCLIHFRVATHKNVDGKNCHPWRVSDDLVFIHNGTINFLPPGNDDLSDTGNFNELIMKPLISDYPQFFNTKPFKWLVENSISSNNKLAFLDKKGELMLVHAEQGKWEEGCWFSNTSYKSWVAGFKTVVGQKTGYTSSTVTYNTTAKTNLETKNVSSATTIDAEAVDPDDAISAADLEATVEGKASDTTFYNSIEELDAALERVNSGATT